MFSVKRQIQKIEALRNLISECKAYRGADETLILPTGDGMAIGFLQGPELPLNLAIELHRKLKVYNKGKTPEEMLKVRIGLNDGPVYLVSDLKGDDNIWGPGIILAKRVMDVGEQDHILLTARMAEALLELSDEYNMLIKPLHDYTIKHGKTVLLYSVYGNGIGNPAVPQENSYQKSKMGEEIAKRKGTTIYHNIDVALTIKDPRSMLTHHRRYYQIENIADQPIEQILHGIATDVRKSFLDLNVKAVDESGKELKITSINLDKPYQKEFTVLLAEPLERYERTSYSLEYDIEEPERYLENHFHISCRKYSMSLVYPSGADFKPVVYDVIVEKDKKVKSKTQPVLRTIEGSRTKAMWSKTNISEGQAFRMQW